MRNWKLTLFMLLASLLIIAGCDGKNPVDKCEYLYATAGDEDLDGGSSDEYSHIYVNWTYEGLLNEEIEDLGTFIIRVRDQSEDEDFVFQSLEKENVKGDAENCVYRICMERNRTIDGHRYTLFITARDKALKETYRSDLEIETKNAGSSLEFTTVVKK